MRRVIAAMACGLGLAACSMSMPSLDGFRSSPATEVLRVESEPPGADARTDQGQSCRTPCELTVPTGGELAVTFALNGYEPTTVPVRMEAVAGGTKLQPNPVYGELQPLTPPRPQKKRPAPAKKKTVQQAPPPPPAESAPAPAAVAEPSAALPSGYPWPPAPSAR